MLGLFGVRLSTRRAKASNKKGEEENGKKESISSLVILAQEGYEESYLRRVLENEPPLIGSAH